MNSLAPPPLLASCPADAQAWGTGVPAWRLLCPALPQGRDVCPCKGGNTNG